jgi:hypothetical protein
VSGQVDRAGMDAPHLDRRRQELIVDDEQGLLQLQVVNGRHVAVRVLLAIPVRQDSRSRGVVLLQERIILIRHASDVCTIIIG